MKEEPVFWLLLGVLALSVGSFLNVVIYRLPRMILQPRPGFSLMRPPSHCPCCAAPVWRRDRIPLLSWLMLGGRCRHCRQTISWHYPATEAASAALALLLALRLPWDGALLALLLLSAWLLALSLIDLRWQLLPDSLTLSLLWLGLLFQACGTLPHSDPAGAIVGAAGGYLLFWLLAWAYRSLRQREGLGGGDAKLLAALGAWLGWEKLPLLLLIAASAALSAVLLARLLMRRPCSQPLPFGPCLALAGALLLHAPG